jgi:hypothetical protein
LVLKFKVTHLPFQAEPFSVNLPLHPSRHTTTEDGKGVRPVGEGAGTLRGTWPSRVPFSFELVNLPLKATQLLELLLLVEVLASKRILLLKISLSGPPPIGLLVDQVLGRLRSRWTNQDDDDTRPDQG